MNPINHMKQDSHGNGSTNSLEHQEGKNPLTLFEPPTGATLDPPKAGRGRRGHENIRDAKNRGGPDHPAPLAPLPGLPPLPQLAPELRPRERLINSGPDALSSAELVGVVLGGEDPETLRLAADLISAAGGLSKLRAASYQDLRILDGAREGALPTAMTRTRASKVVAAIELGKRMMEERAEEPPTISSPADLDKLLGPRLRDLEQEHFVAVLLGTRNQVLASPTVSVGTVNSSHAHPREVFKPAIKAAAAGVILAHNHPAGHLKPSTEDITVTRRLMQAGKTIGIDVIDHVIIARGGHASLKELGMMEEV